MEQSASTSPQSRIQRTPLHVSRPLLSAEQQRRITNPPTTPVTRHWMACVRMAAPTGLAAAACPAYPWPHDGAQRGQKVFTQSDCAACHSMLPYASLRDAARGEEVGAKAAEIVVAEEAQPAAAAATARPLHGGAYPPDLTTIVTKIPGGLWYSLYSTGGEIATTPRMLADGAAVCQELKKMMALPSPVWLQFVQPYTRTFQAA